MWSHLLEVNWLGSGSLAEPTFAQITVCVHLCMWKLKGNFSCHSPGSVNLPREKAFLTDLELRNLVSVARKGTPTDPRVSTSIALGLHDTVRCIMSNLCCC